MRKFIRIALMVVILILIYVGYIFVSTGFFRSIEPKFDGVILEKIALPGAEDIMVSRVDSFALISSTARTLRPTDKEQIGGLFLIDLKKKGFVPIPLTSAIGRPFAPHGISYFKKDSLYQVMAINHTLKGHAIEVFELHNTMLTPIKTLTDSTMVSPNDLVMIDENRFYFTNDHRHTAGYKRLAEDYLGLSLSNVVYFDGTTYNEVASGIAYANGINYDPKRNLLYVASVRDFLVKVFMVNPDGSLSFIEDIPCGTGVDNIELDASGDLWIGAHPNLLRFQAYSAGKRDIAPSEIIKIVYRKQGDYSIATMYLEDGQDMTGASVATTFGDLIFTGNVMDDEFLVLKRNRNTGIN